MRYKSLLLASALILATSVASSAEDVVIDQSNPIVAKTDQAQRFADYIDLKSGQEKLPLTLTFTNGGDIAAGFKWLRISIAGRPFLTEQDFKGGRTMSISMGGDLGSGSSQIVILAGGMSGATISWKLTTPAVTLTSVKPKKVATGAKLTLSGSNFSFNPAGNVVTIGDKSAQVTSAQKNTLEVTVPDDAKAGKSNVAVSVCGIKSGSVQVEVCPKPVVTGVNFSSTAPGQPVVISGKNFSPNAGENKVLFGEYPAEITQASTTSLSAIVPWALDPVQPQWYVPITVEVNGAKSNADVTIDIQSRVIESGQSIQPSSD